MSHPPQSLITPPPIPFETLCHTIVQLTLPRDNKGALLADSAPMQAMEQLVAVIDSLHQSIQQHGATSSEGHSEAGWTIDTLLPYVSEEANDVLDALQGMGAIGVTGVIGEMGAPELVVIGNLGLRLLWSVMRSSYPVMRLLEGVEVKQCQADQNWIGGMLRLVVLLDMQLPGMNGCFDLTTHQPPENLLKPDTWLQTEEPILPLPESPLTFVVGIADHALISAGQQLQALKHQIRSTDPALDALFAGVPVTCLYPGQGWQSGRLHLKLGFEFVAQPAIGIAPSPQVAPDLVEAEIIEDAGLVIASSASFREINSRSQVSVIELPHQSLAAAKVRFKDLPAVGSSLLPWRWLEMIAPDLPALSSTDRDRFLCQIVTAACEVADARHRSIGLSTQPLRLIDELLPRLLWQISRSSCATMQLLGGATAQVLRPGHGWQQGILRLLPTLHIQTTAADYRFDLVTRQPLRPETEILPVASVCQQTLPLGLAIQSPLIPSLQNPIQTQELLSQLQQQWQQTSPEAASLTQGIEIEWSEANQDWQGARLLLVVHLAFIPTAPLAEEKVRGKTYGV